MPKTNSNLVRQLAPEEIKPGAYVIVLDEVLEYLPCCFDGILPPSEPVKIRWLPRDPEPLEVLSTCMPYVFARRPDRVVVTLDVRRHKLGRLDKRALKSVLKRMRSKRQRRRGFRLW